MGDVLRSVQGGSLAGRCARQASPRPFSRLYINMVRAGEKGGVLETTLRRLAGFLEESQEFRDALVSALIYPVLLTGVGAAAVVFLMTFVIPRFAAIFKDLGATIPLPTLILLEVSGAIQRCWWLLALVALGACWRAGWCSRRRGAGSAPIGCSCGLPDRRARSSSRPRWRASPGSWARCSGAASP